MSKYKIPEEQSKQLLDAAIEQFKQMLKETGHHITDTICTVPPIEVFVAGYCAGWNDWLLVTRGQNDVVENANEILKNASYDSGNDDT